MKYAFTLTTSRRRFLTATVGGVLLPGAMRLNAATEGETFHFHYRLAPAGPYIDSERGNQALDVSEDKILRSEDNGKTGRRKAALRSARHITFS